MCDTFHLQEESKITGPFDEGQITRMLRVGRIKADTPCRRGHSSGWTTLREALPHLFDQIGDPVYPLQARSTDDSEGLEAASAEPHELTKPLDPKFKTKANSSDDLKDPSRRNAEQTLSIDVRKKPFSQPSLPHRLSLGSIFTQGEIAAERYQVIRLIGRGGMGEVYEALDLELQQRVALKTIRPDVDDQKQYTARFKREIQLARKVTHPNVCRIFDLGIHRQPAVGNQPGRELVFLTMELLPGETLENRLRRFGKLSPDEALPVIMQLVEALGAAHGSGVVHRDLKPANIMLVPGSTEEEPERVVVTDFGLARTAAYAQTISGVHTLQTGLVGTPLYMSPEQLESQTATEKSDIYALGVVIFQMVTGSLPYTAENPLAAAIKCLREPPISPRSLSPELDPVWETAILRCLSLKPEDRFHNVWELGETLGGEKIHRLDDGQTPPPEGVPVPRKWKQPRTAIILTSALLLSLAALAMIVVPLFLRKDISPDGNQVETGALQRPAMAVFNFKNRTESPDVQWLSIALAEMIRTELAFSEAVRLIPGENIARAMMELSLPESDSLAPDTLQRIRANLGSQWVASGSFIHLGGEIQVSVWVQDTLSGETLVLAVESGAESNLFQLVSNIGEYLCLELHLGEITPGDSQKALAALPVRPEALKRYAQGLEKLRFLDALSARDLLEKAVRIEPGCAVIHLALADAWDGLGYDEFVRAEVQEAFDLSSNLNREDRLQIEGRYHEVHFQWEKAIQIYLSLLTFYPDNLEYGLRLASVQRKAGQGAEALKTLEQLRRLPAPEKKDPRIDLAGALVYGELSDYQNQLAMAQNGIEKGTLAGAHLLTAKARLIQAKAYRIIGQFERALESAEKSKTVFAARGDRAGVARANIQIGLTYFYQGDLNSAEKMLSESFQISTEIGYQREIATALNYQAWIIEDRGRPGEALLKYNQALAIYKRIADRTSQARVLSSMANIYYLQGEIEKARKQYEQCLHIFKETGSESGLAHTKNNLANLLSEIGDLDEAAQMYEEALATWRKLGEKTKIIAAYGNLGELRLTRGDLVQAETLFREALVLSREVGNRSFEAWALFGLGDIDRACDKPAAARRKYEEALSIESEIGEKTEVPSILISLARMALAENLPANALNHAIQAEKEFIRQGSSEGMGQALAVQALAFLAQKDIPAAEERLTAARGKDGATRPMTRFLIEIAGAHLWAARNQCRRAVQNLKPLSKEWRETGFEFLYLETELMLGTIELRCGQTEKGRQRLEKLRKSASAKGFSLIARQAREAVE